MTREAIKQTLIDHGVSDISGALLDELAALTKPAVKCGDGGAPLCSACSAPITELVQEPGCGGPLAALTKPAVPDVREAFRAGYIAADPDCERTEQDENEMWQEYATALTQSPTCCEAERWQPIETAAKELGAGVLAWDEKCADEPYIASWTRTGWFDGVVFRAPVAWQPLPAPPATAIRGADHG